MLEIFKSIPKKILHNLFIPLLFLLVSFCNKGKLKIDTNQAKIQMNPHLELQTIVGEWQYYPNYIVNTSRENLTFKDPFTDTSLGLYRLYIVKDSLSTQKNISLKLSTYKVEFQVLWNGNLVYSKVPNIMEKYNNTSYLIVPIEKEINTLDLLIFPSTETHFSKLHSLTYIPDKNYFAFRLRELIFEVFTIFLIVLGLIYSIVYFKEKNYFLILINLLLTFCFFLLNTSVILEIFWENEENISQIRDFFQILLILSQIFVVHTLSTLISKNIKWVFFLSYLSLTIGLIFFYDYLCALEIGKFLILFLPLQAYYFFWKTYQTSSYLRQLETYAENYKTELRKVKQQLIDFKASFHQKIIDKSYYLATYMEKLEIQTLEIEKLNELIVQLLEDSNIDTVLDLIFEHIITYYKADIAFLYFIDPQTNEFYAYRGMTKNIPEEIHKFLKETKMPISKEAGLSYLAYKRKKIIYKENTKTKYKKYDEKRDMKLPEEVLSALYIPIMIKNEFQGIFFLSSFNHSMNLNKEKLKYISMFANQVSSAIQKDKILKKIQNEKKKLEEERERSEKLRIQSENINRQLEAINLLTKSINENLELKVIMEKIMNFVGEYFGITYYSLFIVNPKKTKVKMLEAKFPEDIDSKIKKKIMDIAIPIEHEGTHALIYKTQKMIYFKNLDVEYTCAEEKEALSYLNIASMVGIPLKVKGEIIGILSFFSSSKMKLSKTQLRTLANLGEHIAGVIHNSRLYQEINSERDKSEKLLLSILPPKIALELKNTGKVVPEIYESASILFTDFVGFTKIAEKLLPKQLLIELDGFFTFFDFICEKYNLEKLKTIGDSYMCAGGLPTRNYSHPIDICLAALEFRDFALRMQEVAAVSKEENFIIWELRIGIHTGSVIGGVIGTTKFAYDVWGDTVNIASRVESSGMPNRINVSGSTYELVKDLFTFEYRGKVSAKNKGSIDMYFLNGIRPEFSKSGEGIIPNQEFWDYYREVVNRKILLEKTKQEVNI